MDGTASLVNREIGCVLPASYRKVPFSGAVEHLNRAATAPYFGQLSGESLETRTPWRSRVDSNLRCREGFYGQKFGPSLARYSAQQKATVLERICSPLDSALRRLSPVATPPRLNTDARRRRRSDQSFRFKSERLDHRHPVSVAHRLDGADDADGAHSR
jgi:hypothetical protein